MTASEIDWYARVLAVKHRIELALQTDHDHHEGEHDDHDQQAQDHHEEDGDDWSSF